MTYATLNATNLNGLFQYVESIVSSFSAFLIGAFFFIILLYTYFSAIRMGRNPNLSVSFAAASFSSLILTLILTLIPGFVPTTVLMIMFALFAVGVIWLFFSQRVD